ncbi:type I restriction endonuclease subunit R [Mycoplasma sp. 613B]
MINKFTDKEKSFEEKIIDDLININNYSYFSFDNINSSFDRNKAIDQERLFSFIKNTQSDYYYKNHLDTETGKTTLLSALNIALQNEGIINILKNGYKDLILFYHLLDDNIKQEEENFKQNIFSVTNQLHYDDTSTKSVDLCIFINGLPIFTMELKSKNSSTNQTFKDAEEQYKNTRDSSKTLFSFKRCIAHFAVDENQISFTTKINGENTLFIPFNKDFDDDNSNIPLKSDFLWKEIFNKKNLTNLITNFCYVNNNKETNKEEVLYFPRYHQWRVVNKLIEAVKNQKENENGKYLIQHSAGSGKSNSITWLAFKLITAKKNNKNIFDSIIVATDRKNLNQQINKNVSNFNDLKSNRVKPNKSNDLTKALKNGKKLIVTTIQKFLHTVKNIESSFELQNKKFAVIIDEAHSSQSGSTASNMNVALSGGFEQEENSSTEDLLIKYMKLQHIPKNVTFFAFTATPKAETLEKFGDVFDSYSMKQAIKEGFILNVLENYTTYTSYGKIKYEGNENPFFEVSKAKKEIKKLIKKDELNINKKSEIIVKHFIEKVSNKINNNAKAMLVTSGIEQAIKYYFKINELFNKQNTNYKALVAFSGEQEVDGQKYTETSINKFSETQTTKEFKDKNENKILIVANKYQTGYDEPLLHTMYVDKHLEGVNAVQTLSRLNRCHKNKKSTFILDFQNDWQDILDSFQKYYGKTKLKKETDPTQLKELFDFLDNQEVYTNEDVNEFCEKYLKLKNEDFLLLNPILDKCESNFNNLEINTKIQFKSTVAKVIKTVNYLLNIINNFNPEWYKKAVFFNWLLKRLHIEKENNDLSEIAENISLEDFILIKNKEENINLIDGDTTLSAKDIKLSNVTNQKIDSLENIINIFNEQFKDIKIENQEKIANSVLNLYNQVSDDDKLKNALASSNESAIEEEYENAFKKNIQKLMAKESELFNKIRDNEDFAKWLKDFVFEIVMNNVAKN